MAGVMRVLAGGRALVRPGCWRPPCWLIQGLRSCRLGGPLVKSRTSEEPRGQASRVNLQGSDASGDSVLTGGRGGFGTLLGRGPWLRTDGSDEAAAWTVCPGPLRPLQRRRVSLSRSVQLGFSVAVRQTTLKLGRKTAPPSVAFSPGGPLHPGRRVRCLVRVRQPGLSWLPSAALQPGAGCLEAPPCSTGHSRHGQPGGRGGLQPAELAEALALGPPSPRHWCLCPFLRLTAFSKHALLGPRPGGHMPSPELTLLSSPFSLCCIAPVLAAKVLRSVEVTVGHEQEEGGKWPYAGTAQVIKALGAKHCVTGVTISFQQRGRRGKPPSGPLGPPWGAAQPGRPGHVRGGA